jgi:hypothetical protein
VREYQNIAVIVDNDAAKCGLSGREGGGSGGIGSGVEYLV